MTLTKQEDRNYSDYSNLKLTVSRNNYQILLDNILFVHLSQTASAIYEAKQKKHKNEYVKRGKIELPEILN